MAGSGLRCECMSCGRIFSGMRNFDLHRIDVPGQGRRCRSDEELRRDVHLVVNVKGWWGRPPDPRHAAELERRRTLPAQPRTQTPLLDAVDHESPVPAMRESSVFAVRRAPPKKVARPRTGSGPRSVRRRIA